MELLKCKLGRAFERFYGPFSCRLMFQIFFVEPNVRTETDRSAVGTMHSCMPYKGDLLEMTKLTEAEPQF